jgi:hypothetical protein
VAVSSSSASGNPTEPLTVAAPAGVRQGDLLLASIAVDGAGADGVTSPPGWTEVPGAEARIAAGGVRTETIYTVAGSSAPAEYTFPSGSHGDWDVVITDFDGTDGLRPVEAAAAQVNPSAAAGVSAPSITPTAPGSTLVFVGIGAPGPGWVPPPGFSEQTSVKGTGAGAIAEMVASETGLSRGANGTGERDGGGAGGERRGAHRRCPGRHADPPGRTDIGDDTGDQHLERERDARNDGTSDVRERLSGVDALAPGVIGRECAVDDRAERGPRRAKPVRGL